MGRFEPCGELYQRTGYPGLSEGLLTDSRIQHVVGDGRQYLMQRPEGFDVIEADALRPGSAYPPGTCTRAEYFELVRSRLQPGGLGATWAPTPRIQHTFEQVFPHVAEVPPMLVGSNEPIPFDVAVIRSRASQPHVVEHYRRAGIELATHIEQLVATFRHHPPLAEPIDDGLINTDSSRATSCGYLTKVRCRPRTTEPGTQNQEPGTDKNHRYASNFQHADDAEPGGRPFHCLDECGTHWRWRSTRRRVLREPSLEVPAHVTPLFREDAVHDGVTGRSVAPCLVTADDAIFLGA